MIVFTYTRRLRAFKKIVYLLIALLWTPSAHAVDWISFTWDNDMFIGSDDGYTSGLFGTWFDVGRNSGKAPEPSFLVAPLLWSLDDTEPLRTVNANTIGHMMVTPADITRSIPDPNDVPYSGLLYYVNSHLRIYENHADKISTTIGFIGPDSGAEAMQEFIHDAIDSDQPNGWDHQLKNELAFRFSRDRTWRIWVNEEQPNIDILALADINVGTLETSAGAYMMLRYGRGLLLSYPTAGFRHNRSINPLALEGGWNTYLGFGVRYIAHLFYLDGNTFEDGPSVDYERLQAGASFGVAHSWQNAAITLAVEDMFLFDDRHEGVARYATLTFAYKL
jgi:lipid A 3-O-deacylase